jgi:phenylpropionate dioxygenase-like ring-hydroxylating dioxygenase large terminal subunit
MSRQRIGEVAEILLDYFEHNKTFQTDKIMVVPAASYTDPEQWRAEINLIFKRVPLMLALTCEMPKAGDYKAMEGVGLPVLIARDKTGTVRAFLNVCAHRWAPVATEGRMG